MPWLLSLPSWIDRHATSVRRAAWCAELVTSRLVSEATGSVHAGSWTVPPVTARAVGVKYSGN